MADEIKIGAYICAGCGLGERLDHERLETLAVGEGKASLVRRHDFLCSQGGVETIQADLDSGAVNRLVIAACSARAKSEAFRFGDTPLSRANLREGVIWTQTDSDENREATRDMAEDYLRMACKEVRFMSAPEASGQQSTNRSLLVVGGGFSGLTPRSRPPRRVTSRRWLKRKMHSAASPRGCTGASRCARPMRNPKIRGSTI